MQNIDSIQVNLDNEDLSNVIEKTKSKPLYATLVILDLTYLNSNSDYGMETGSRLKQKVQEFINNRTDIVFEKVIGGKIFFFTENPLESSFKRTLNSISKNELGTDTKVLFLEEDKLGPFQQNFDTLLKLGLSKEAYLSSLRASAQEKLKKLEQGKGEKEAEKIRKEWEEIDQKIGPREYDLSSPKESYKIARNSKHLSYAVYYYFNNKLGDSFNELVKYFLWNEIQKLLFEGFKTEKVRHYIYMPKNSEGDEDIKLPQNAIETWFASVIKPLYPYLNEKNLKKAEDIETKLKNADISDKELRKHLAKEIKELIENVHVKGIYNIPLTNLNPSQEAIQFVNRQFYLIYGQDNSQIQMNKWINSSYVRSHYPLASYPSIESLWNSMMYHAPQASQQQESSKFHFIFLELDGFNAFNTYLFPNDSDHVYNRIIDILYESGNKFITRNNKLFKTLTISMMGDEFFLSFIGDGRSDEENDIIDYLKEVKKTVLDYLKDYRFANSEKIKTNVEGGEIYFRRLIEGESSHFDIEVAKIGVSGVYIPNQPLTYENLEGSFENAETLMEQVKNFHKGRIIRFEKENTEGFFTKLRPSAIAGYYSKKIG